MAEGRGVLRALLLPGATFAVFLLLWEAAVEGRFAPATIAAPSGIAATVYSEWGTLWFHMEPTLLTATIGYLAAAATALCLGFLVYSFRRIESSVLTVGAVLDSIPIIAVAPILIIWMGLSLSTRITITAVICLFPMLISTVQGLNSQPKNARELFAVLAATRLQTFRLLALPNALPYIFVGLKIAAPLAVLGALVAEWTGAERGLGVLMTNAMSGFLVVRLWASIAVACALSAGFYLLVCAFERLSIPDGGLRQGAGK